ncbi:hypothetical protein U1Q18_032034 [Sarracenia purpurea var. burkii]
MKLKKLMEQIQDSVQEFNGRNREAVLFRSKRVVSLLNAGLGHCKSKKAPKNPKPFPLNILLVLDNTMCKKDHLLKPLQLL